MKKLQILFICFLLGSCSKDAEIVSLVEVIANQSAYDGDRVVTEGYLVNDFENVALYLSSEHAKNLVTKNAVWLSFDSDTIYKVNSGAGLKIVDSAVELSNRYVTVSGVYKSGSQGHGGMYSGSLDAITEVQGSQ